jgi:TetR/AcrR family transcriptional repressor of mexJK operon
MTMDQQPRTRDPDGKMQAIIDAATELFVEQGYFPTTLADIAERAQVSKGTITLHFGSKANLGRQVVVQHSASMHDHLIACAEDYVDVEDSIRRGVADYVRWCRDNPYKARYLLAVRHREFVDIHRPVHDIAHDRVVELIKRGQQQGLVQPGDPTLLAYMVGAGADRIIRIALEWNARIDLSEVADVLGELAWDTVRAANGRTDVLTVDGETEFGGR